MPGTLVETMFHVPDVPQGLGLIGDTAAPQDQTAAATALWPSTNADRSRPHKETTSILGPSAKTRLWHLRSTDWGNFMPPVETVTKEIHGPFWATVVLRSKLG